MQLIQNGTQGSTTPPAPKRAVGTPGYANNSPGVTASSRWDADNANALMAEIISVLTAAGITLDPSDNAQLLKAIRAIGFPTGLGSLTTATTITGTNAGNFYNVNGSGPTITLNASTFTARQTIGFNAVAACTITTSSGAFYGGSLAGSSIAMPAGSFVALQWDGINWRQLAGSFLAEYAKLTHFGTNGSAEATGAGDLTATATFTPICNGIIILNGNCAATNGTITSTFGFVVTGCTNIGSTGNFATGTNGAVGVFTGQFSATAGTPISISITMNGTGDSGSNIGFVYSLIPTS